MKLDLTNYNDYQEGRAHAKQDKLDGDFDLSEAIASFDIQTDYVSSLSDEEKVDLFRRQTGEVQEHADKIWLQDHSEYPYSDAFMAGWITEHYASAMKKLLVNPEYGDGGAEVRFYFKDGTSIDTEAPICWCEMPRKLLLQFLMNEEGIDPSQVKDHLLSD